MHLMSTHKKCFCIGIRKYLLDTSSYLKLWENKSSYSWQPPITPILPASPLCAEYVSGGIMDLTISSSWPEFLRVVFTRPVWPSWPENRCHHRWVPWICTMVMLIQCRQARHSRVGLLFRRTLNILVLKFTQVYCFYQLICLRTAR